MLCTIIIVTFLVAILVSFIRWFFDPYFRYNSRKKVKEITFFENGKAVGTKKPFIFENMEKDALYDLTLVVPAYNEELRLPIMMKETIAYLEKLIAKGMLNKVEMILVDDGSKDKTLE